MPKKNPDDVQQILDAIESNRSKARALRDQANKPTTSPEERNKLRKRLQGIEDAVKSWHDELLE